MKKFWYLLALVALLAGGVRAANLNGISWTDRSLHISTGDLVTTGAAFTDWEEGFNAAVARWNLTSAPFTITTDSNTQGLSCDFNDPSTAFFSADACGNTWQTGVVGFSLTWSSTHNGAASKTAVVFNSAKTWGLYNGPPSSGQTEFTRVAVHELGHSMGLAHSTTPNAIMQPISGATIEPQNDDIAGINRLYNVNPVVVLDDINGSGFQEIAPIRIRLPNRTGRVQLREANSGSLLKSFSYFSGYTPLTMIDVEDRSGNGVRELASIQRRNSDGRTLVEMRDPVSGSNVGNVWFSPLHTPFFAGELPDISGNGVPEIVVLQVRDSDGAVAAQIRDSVSGSFVRNVYFSPGFSPIDFVIVPDINGNGAPEVATALSRFSDTRVLVQLRDTETGAAVASIWQSPGHSVHNIAVVADTNSNGAADIATLVTRDSDGIIGVRIADGSTGAQLRTNWYRPAGSTVFAKHALVALPDVDGNNVEELAILVQTQSTQRTVLATRDALTGNAIGNIFVSPDFDAERLVVLDSVNGNNSSELGVYGFGGNLLPQVILYDSSTSTRLNTVYYPSMID